MTTEKNILHRYLQRSRESVLWKLEGLGERDMRWPMTRTGTNLLGLVKHLAGVELGYFGEVFDRPSGIAFPWLDDDMPDNADMWASADESSAEVIDLYRRAWAHSDQTIDELPLDARGRVPWWGDAGGVTLHRILIHVIDETARHAGHADILRELIDGSAGVRADNSNLPDHDEAWWADYVATLERAAEEAARP
ncbi:MAG: DinB family protein [Cryobacterium sp.]|nr:DinB family protein [Cryobacterium sp.]